MARDRISAGKLDRRITIQYPAVTKTAYGNDKPTWTNWKTDVAAEQQTMQIPDERNDEFIQLAVQNIQWRIRFHEKNEPNVPSIPDAKMRLFDQRYPNKIYEVENVEEIGRREGWLLRTKLKG